MTHPALWIPVSNLDRRSGTGPHFRWVNPTLARDGWRAFLGPTIELVREYRPTVAFLWLPFGTCSPIYPSVKEMGRGPRQSFEQRQDFEAYPIAKYRGILQDTLMDTVQLGECIADFGELGCKVIPYFGPWNRNGFIGEDDAWEAVEPFARVVCKIAVDGTGAKDPIELFGILDRFGFGTILEPMSQRIDARGRPLPDLRHLPSLTLSQTLNHPEAFYPLNTYTGTRYWLDNERSHLDLDYHTRFDKAVLDGFVPCLPFLPEAWSMWRARNDTDTPSRPANQAG